MLHRRRSVPQSPSHSPFFRLPLGFGLGTPLASRLCTVGVGFSPASPISSPAGGTPGGADDLRGRPRFVSGSGSHVEDGSVVKALQSTPRALASAKTVGHVG